MMLVLAALVAQFTPPTVGATLFAGPVHAGESVAYRVTTTTGEETRETPNVVTVILTKTATRMYARIANANAAATTSSVVARDSDGKLSIVSPSPGDPALTTVLAQLNFPAQLAATLAGNDHAQTSLSVRPPVPSSTASPAPLLPEPVPVPMTVDMIRSDTSGATLIADGNSQHNAQQSDRGNGGGRRSGGMGGGGWQRGGSGGGWQRGNASPPPGGKPPDVEIAVEAQFDQNGTLAHETYRETFTMSSPNGSKTVERTITIDRVK
jgi:hypothetical protein